MKANCSAQSPCGERGSLGQSAYPFHQAVPGIHERGGLAMRKVLASLYPHAGVSPESPGADGDWRWAVQRGLQLCPQNASGAHRTYHVLRSLSLMVDTLS